jgi:hypothetical protein
MSQRKPMREHISDKVMELVDVLAAFPAETKSVDSRAWQHLLVYVPKEELEARLKKINERKKEDGN